MYLVVAESQDGTWFGDPDGADTLGEARVLAAKQGRHVPASVHVVIYRCSEVERCVPERSPQDLREADPGESSGEDLSPLR